MKKQETQMMTLTDIVNALESMDYVSTVKGSNPMTGLEDDPAFVMLKQMAKQQEDIFKELDMTPEKMKSFQQEWESNVSGKIDFSQYDGKQTIS